MDKHSKKYSILTSVFGLGTTVVLFLIPAQIVMACQPMYPITIIEAQVDKNLLSQEKSCLDQNCQFALEKDQYGYFSLKKIDVGATKYFEERIGSVDQEGKTIEIGYLSFYQSEKILFVEALDTLVENDISDIKPVLFQEIESWDRAGGRKEYPLGGNLTFTPYEQDKESKLLKEKNQLLDCRYTEYKRVGNWLITNSTNRDYCYLARGGVGMCRPSVVISYPQFLAFLLSNINGITAPYLAVFILAILGIAALGIYLIRKKELWFFLRPRKAKIVVTIIAGVLLLPFTFLIGTSDLEINVLWYLLVVYLIVSLIGYIRLKRKVEPKVS